MSNIPQTGDIDVRSSLQLDFSLIQERCDEFSIDFMFNARDVSRLVLRSLNTLDKQYQLLPYVDGLRTDGCESAAPMQSLERQVRPILPSYLRRVEHDLACRSVSIGRRPVRLTYRTVEGECDEHCNRFGIEAQQRAGLEALLRSMHGHLVDHSFLVEYVRDLLC